MGTIIISLPFLGMHFSSVAFLHAGEISKEMGLTNQAEISNELNAAKDGLDFKKVFKKYFGDRIKIKI